MIDDVPTWGEVLDVEEWTPTATVDVVCCIYERYDALPTVPH